MYLLAQNKQVIALTLAYICNMFFSYNSIGQIDNMVHVICSSLQMPSMKYISVITPNEFSVPFSTLAIFWLAYDTIYISYH